MFQGLKKTLRTTLDTLIVMLGHFLGPKKTNFAHQVLARAKIGQKWPKMVIFSLKMTVFRKFLTEISIFGSRRWVGCKIWPKTNIFPYSHFLARPGLAGYHSRHFRKNGLLLTKFHHFLSQNAQFFHVLRSKLLKNQSKLFSTITEESVFIKHLRKQLISVFYKI